MADLLNFMGVHWFLTWCLAWLVWPITWMICYVINLPARLYKLRLRAANIRKFGWPTAHLMNADGDIIHPRKEGEK